MSEIQTIRATLEKTARRRRLNRGFRGMWRGLFAGGVLWFVALAIFKLWPIPGAALSTAGIVAFILPFAGFLAGVFKPLTLLETARWVDSEKGLQERLGTALEFSEGPKEETWRQLLVQDAAKAVSQLNAKMLMPFHLPRTSRWAFLVLALAAGLGFIPEHRTKEFTQKKKDAEVIKDTGRQLAELTRRSLERRTPVLEPAKKALESVGELGDHLAKAVLTKSEALKDLSNVADKLKEQTKEMGKNPAFKALDRAAKTSSKGGAPNSADLQKQIESLQKQMASQAGNPDALDKMQKDVEKAKQMAADMKAKEGADAAEAKEKLSQALADLSKQAKDAGMSLPSLDEAIAALSQSQNDQVLKDLEMTEIDLEKMQSMAKSLQQLQMQAEKLGKDLAEQLKNGQAEAAQSTLQKMAQQLKKSNLGAEDMKKLMEDVSKAVSPANSYGKLPDLLKQAAEQMQKGDKPQAAESLAQAAAELDKMMQEMGDAQSMIAALEALQQAQMAIANGQAFGMGKDGKGQAGKGKGAPKSRGGVGTWTDEDSYQYPEFVDKWDNTGIVRDDMDGKGHTDRGDGQLADNLLPTKVKGQMTPGGPMPSITMKGVSIKGMSKLDYKEVVGAAQSDAQSALNQEQVPRAYQGAVKDYFDDLK